jgi:hypothetical protein
MTILNETLTTLLATHSASDINNELYNIQQRLNRIAELTAQRDTITAELASLTDTVAINRVSETITALDSAIDLERTELARLVSISSGRARGMTIGIEIEFYASVNRREFRECLVTHLESVNSGVRISRDTGGLHNNNATMWKLASDSSVSGGLNGCYHGMELISPILKGESGLMRAVEVMNALEQCGAEVDRHCGVHVHFGIERMEWKSVKRIIETYAHNQDLINSTLPASRRNRHFVRDMPLTSNHNTGWDDYGVNLERISNFDDTYSTDDVVSFLGGSSGYHDSRYFAVNLLGAWSRHKTIEFRAHGGTVDGEKLEMWVRFLHMIVKSAETNRNTNKAYNTLSEMCASLSDKTDLNLTHAQQSPDSDWGRMVTATRTGTDNSTTQSPYRSRAKAQLSGKAISDYLTDRATTFAHIG